MTIFIVSMQLRMFNQLILIFVNGVHNLLDYFKMEAG